MKRLEEMIGYRLSSEAYAKLKAEAEAKDTTPSELTRHIVEQYLRLSSAKYGIAEIEQAVRKVTQKGFERLIGITVHGAIAAGMTAYILRSYLEDAKNIDLDWNSFYADAATALKEGTMKEKDDNV